MARRPWQRSPWQRRSDPLALPAALKPGHKELSRPSLARSLSLLAEQVAKRTAEVIDAAQTADGAIDRADLTASVQAVYAIACKLDEIDQLLRTAAAGGLDRLVDSFDPFPTPNRNGDPDFWRARLDDQELALSQWSKAQGAKRDWFLALVGLRRPVADALIDAYANLLDARTETSFRYGARQAQGLMPELTLPDVAAELLTTAAAADKARALAETVRELELPALPA